LAARKGCVDWRKAAAATLTCGRPSSSSAKQRPTSDLLSLPTHEAYVRRAEGVREAAGRVLIICVLVALVIAFGGAIKDPLQGVVWVGESLLGGAFGLATARWLIPPSWFSGPQWRPALAIAVGVTVPMTVVIVLAAVLVRHVSVGWNFAFEVVPQVFLVSLAMTALAFLVRRPPTATHAAPTGAPPPKFLSRLPDRLKGAELFAVQAEDHYLRLHTSAGQDLILMRLSDAIAELEGIEGAQTHRSWWVARAAVAGAERGEGRATLTLKDGAEVPVSRGFARLLREAGWF
jgi:hypothetical protein